MSFVYCLPIFGLETLEKRTGTILGEFNLANLLSVPSLVNHELVADGSYADPFFLKLFRTDISLLARMLDETVGCSVQDKIDPQSILSAIGDEKLDSMIDHSAMSISFSTSGKLEKTFLKYQWRESLLVAHIASNLSLCAYPDLPVDNRLKEQAYFCGLFSNIGELILAQVFDKQYYHLLKQVSNESQKLDLEKEEFGVGHDFLGAEFLKSLGLPVFCCDAVHYHNEPVTTLLDASRLVKIIWLASRMANRQIPGEEVFRDALELLGIKQSEIESIHQEAIQQVDALTRLINLRFSNEHKLPLSENEHILIQNSEEAIVHELQEYVQAQTSFKTISNQLKASENSFELGNTLGKAMKQLFGFPNCMLFVYNEEDNALSFHSSSIETEDASQLSVVCQAERSLLAESFISGEEKISKLNESLPIIDRQLLSLMGSRNILCDPVVTDGEKVGVLVIGMSYTQAENYLDQKLLRKLILNQLGQILLGQESETIQEEISEETNDLKRIREAVHEANNPLGIIKNYLTVLTHKDIGEEGIQEEVKIIRNEIDRVRDILQDLRQGKKPEDKPEESLTNLNHTLSELHRLFSVSMTNEKNITFALDLDEEAGDIQCNEGQLKQIVTNLVKNAVEAINESGTINIKSTGNFYMAGIQYAQLIIQDDGPGLAGEVLDKLYSAGVSTKEGDSRGSGLSIVKNLIDDAKGVITCQTSAKGTTFTVLFPEAVPVPDI